MTPAAEDGRVPRHGGVRVLTVNLASGRDAAGREVDGPALAAAVAGLDADVVAVQEVDAGQPRSHGVDQPAVLAGSLRARDWRWTPTLAGTPGPAARWRPAEPVARGPDDPVRGPHYGVALFCRLPVRRWHVLGLGTGRARLPLPPGGPFALPPGGPFALPPGGPVALPPGGPATEPPDGPARGLWWLPDEPRVALAAELAGLTVVTTHLSFAPHTAVRQLRARRRWAAALPGPVLVAGDLNLAGPVPELVTGGTRLVRAPTFPAGGPRLQLDHLLSLGGLRGEDPRVHRLAVGDHRAVAATVRPR